MPAGCKLGQRWMGPFEVVKRVGAVAYRLRLPDTLQVHPVFHVSLLRAYHAGGEHRRTLPPDPILVAGAPGVFHEIPYNEYVYIYIYIYVYTHVYMYIHVYIYISNFTRSAFQAVPAIMFKNIRF